jgi:hypothetical protein
VTVTRDEHRAAVVRDEHDLITDVRSDLLGENGSAVFNADRTHRYLLIRRWAPGGKILTWVMLNPSTADAFTDDPTIGRCIGYATDWGYSAIVVVNLFSLRSSSPAALYRHDNPVGDRNDEFLLDVCKPGWLTIAAWGAHGSLHHRAADVVAMLAEAGVELSCLGLNADGSPKHPLYQPSAAPLVPYEVQR